MIFAYRFLKWFEQKTSTIFLLKVEKSVAQWRRKDRLKPLFLLSNPSAGANLVWNEFLRFLCIFFFFSFLSFFGLAHVVWDLVRVLLLKRKSSKQMLSKINGNKTLLNKQNSINTPRNDRYFREWHFLHTASKTSN